MMETILNLGLNDATVEGLARQSGNPQLRLGLLPPVRPDVRQRGVRPAQEAVRASMLEAAQARAAGSSATSTSRWRSMQALVARVQGAHPGARPGATFPDDPLRPALGRHRRGVRELEHPPGDRLPEAARHPRHAWAPRSTSWRWCSATWARTPAPASRSAAIRPPASGRSTASTCSTRRARTSSPAAGRRSRSRRSRSGCPHAYQELERVARTLERHFRDVQDMEFTIERGALYMLQTRRGQRSGHAAVRIACEMVDEGLISEEEAVARIPPNDLNQLLHPTIDPHSQLDLLTTGLPASPGAACGTVVFDADRAEKLGRAGQPVILVRRETSPEDFHGMVVAKAILTARGGMTSHAAVVARGMGKPCVAGAQELAGGRAGRPLRRERPAASPRATGSRWTAAPARCSPARPRSITPELSGDFLRLMQWADRIRQLRVRVNADTPADAHRGRDFGAEGHRALPHRAHVLRGRPAHRHARDDRGAGHGRPAARAGQAAADAARRLRGHLPRDGGLPGHHPAARSAAPRVPAQGAGRDRGARARELEMPVDAAPGA